MAVSATRRNYDVTMATPDGEWHQMCIPATSVPRAISKAYRAMMEKYGATWDEKGKLVSSPLARGDIGIFSVTPELKTVKGEDVPNWPTIRARKDFELPEAVLEHEYDIETDEE